MLNVVVMLMLAALPSNHSSSDDQDVERITRLRKDDAVQRLAAEPLEVPRTYDALVAKDNAERMRAYAELPASSRASMWNHQLLVALVEHPEFTDEQRAVLYDAIELFTPEFFEITFESPNWSSRVDLPLRKLEQRVKAALGIVLTGQLLAHLGPDQRPIVAPQIRATSSSSAASQGTSKGPGKLRPAPNDLPNCSCSTTSDYCAVEYGPDWYCLGGGCVWGVNWGCGTALAYPCNGLCDLRRFQN